MPYVLIKQDGKRYKGGLRGMVWLQRDIDNWQRNSKRSESLTFLNTTTRRSSTVRGLR